MADTKISKEKCAKCSVSLSSNIVPVRCRACNKGFHQKCSAVPEVSNSDDQWKSDAWIKVQQNQITVSSVCQLPGSTNSIPSQPQLAASCNKLKIYQ